MKKNIPPYFFHYYVASVQNLTEDEESFCLHGGSVF